MPDLTSFPRESSERVNLYSAGSTFCASAADARRFFGALRSCAGRFEFRLRADTAGFELTLSLEPSRELTPFRAHLLEHGGHVFLGQRDAFQANLFDRDAVVVQCCRGGGRQ